MKTPVVRFASVAAFVALGCLLTGNALAGVSSAMTKNSGDEARAMFQVQSRLRTAEDKLAQLKEDDAKPDPALRMSAPDRSVLLKDITEELEGAKKSLAEGKASLNGKTAGDFNKRIATATRALAQAAKGPKVPAAKPAAK